MKVTETLEKIVNSAKTNETEVLLDATSTQSAKHTSLIQELCTRGRLHRIHTSVLEQELDYLNFLTTLTKEPCVKTTKRVLDETRRAPQIINREYQKHLAYSTQDRNKIQIAIANARLIEECLIQFQEYIQDMDKKTYDTTNKNYTPYFIMSATIKAITIMSQNPKSKKAIKRKIKKRQKYPNLKGEDSLAAIAIQRSIIEQKETDLISNDHHLAHIINNFYTFTKALDHRCKQDMHEKLNNYPIRVYRMKSKKYRVTVDTADEQTMQGLPKIIQEVGEHKTRNGLILLRKQLDKQFGKYANANVSKIIRTKK